MPSATCKDVPGVQHVGTHIGQAFLADEIAGVNFGEDWIAVDPNANYGRPSRRSRRSSTNTPGAFHDVQTYLNERIDEVLAGSSDPIVIRVFGNDLATLHKEADDVRCRHLSRQGRGATRSSSSRKALHRRRSRSSSRQPSITV